MGCEMSEPVMYIVVNSDLKMSGGKMAAQVAHSAVKASNLGQHKVNAVWLDWFQHSYTKIILKASEFEMNEIKKKYPDITVTTIDEGRTEISKGSFTTLAFIPMPKENAPEEVKKLRLL